MEDLKGVWVALNKSPLWNRLLAQGKALAEQAKKVGEETKGEVTESASKIADSENLKKLKEDLVGVLQLGMHATNVSHNRTN